MTGLYMTYLSAKSSPANRRKENIPSSILPKIPSTYAVYVGKNIYSTVYNDISEGRLSLLIPPRNGISTPWARKLLVFFSI